MIVDECATSYSREDGIFRYPSGDRLEYYRKGEEHIFDYHANGTLVRLNDLAPNPFWSCRAVYSRFQVLYGNERNALPRPEIHFSLCRSSVPGLQEELSVLAALHEIGHAQATHTAILAQFPGELSPESYSSLALKCAYAKPREEDERQAWAFALRTVRQLKLLVDFDVNDFRSFYWPPLSSYGCAKGARPPMKFLSGDPDPWTTRTEQRSWLKA